jgi:hypothetical protein
MAVVMASSDMPEILGLSHRAFVMRAGTVAAELDRSELDHVDVRHRSSGSRRDWNLPLRQLCPPTMSSITYQLIIPRTTFLLIMSNIT